MVDKCIHAVVKLTVSEVSETNDRHYGSGKTLINGERKITLYLTGDGKSMKRTFSLAGEWR